MVATPVVVLVAGAGAFAGGALASATPIPELVGTVVGGLVPVAVLVVLVVTTRGRVTSRRVDGPF